MCFLEGLLNPDVVFSCQKHRGRFPGMWVLEGDEVVAVNGTNVEGKSLDEVPGADPRRNTVGLYGGKAPIINN